MDDDAVLSDVQYLRRFVGGDQSAFGLLYDRHDCPCLAFIRRLLVPPDETAAEDLHQEVWVAVARGAATFDPAKARFVTWLFTIARNRVIDHLRHKSSLFRLVAEDGDDEWLEAQPAHADWQPDERLHRQRLGAAIATQLRHLPHAQRETFVLFALEDMTLEEVAVITQVGVETAKSRLRYARAALREKLGDWRLQHG